MPKSLLEQKLKKINDEQERRIEQAKKEISKEYKEKRADIYRQCKENNHKYDNGKTAIFTTNRGKYCEICGQLI